MRETTERDARIVALDSEGRSVAAIAAALAAERPDWALSPGSVSRILTRLGRRRRSVRSDAGRERRTLPDDLIAGVAALKLGFPQDEMMRSSSQRPQRPGKRTVGAVSTAAALREMASRGVGGEDISPGVINRRLRDRYGLLQRGAEARRTGPDVVRRFSARRAMDRVQFDGTLLNSFYLDASGDIVYMPDTEAKQQRKAEGRTRAYVLAFVDDHSRCVRFRACDGETARHVVDFARELTTHTRDQRNPLCGVPRVIYADNGSAACSAMCRAVWSALGVTLVTHAPRAPWGKGKVEAAFARTRGMQDLTRGLRLRGFSDLNLWLADLAAELNHAPMDALGGVSPATALLASAAARQGEWVYAPDDDAIWRRWRMRRIPGLRVSPDLTISLGGGERVALPHGRPYVDWIGRRITALIDTDPGEQAADGGARSTLAGSVPSLLVIGPDHTVEHEVPRAAPETYASLLTMPVVDGARSELVRMARAAVDGGLLGGDLGAWIGDRAADVGAPAGRTLSTDDLRARSEAIRPDAVVTRRQAEGEMLDQWGSVDHAMLDAIFAGADTCRRADLTRLLTTGEAA